MRKSVLFLFFTLSLLFCFGQKSSIGVEEQELLDIMKRVADRQILHQSEVKHQPLGWENAALYMGMIDWAELAETELNDKQYYKFIYDIGSRGGWQPAKRMYHADDLCISQVYIDLYRKYNRLSMLWPTFARVQWVMRNPPENNMKLDYSTGKGLDKWSWCDALFMAPPVYVKLYIETGEEAYIEFADSEYKDSYNYLFDKEENLFYRDWRYFGKYENNGKKIFWGRGNGWVIAGLCEILKELPRGDKYRDFYETLYIDLSESLLKCQQEDGYWHASLLDPDSYPSPETSSTGFIVYAFAYGVNEGLLPRERFLPAVAKGWRALTAAVEKDGKLGYVQPVGEDPRHVTKDMTEVYGVGAFLMAGCEIYNYLQGQNGDDK